MKSQLSLDQIREFWTRQAVEHGQAPAASWSDTPVIDLEIAEISRWLDDGDRVLDIGCANGYSTVQLATRRKIEITGADYIAEMIEHATERLAALDAMGDRVSFRVADIMAMPFDAETYDKVVVVRVLINLGDWHHQALALNECLRVLRPGGLLLLSEATLQGWTRLNALREEWGLEAISMPSFNLYLDEEQVVEAASGQCELVEIVNFASTYYVGTRLLKPLLASATSAPIDVASPRSEWNRFCSMLPVCGDYGTQKLFVFRKR